MQAKEATEQMQILEQGRRGMWKCYHEGHEDL